MDQLPDEWRKKIIREKVGIGTSVAITASQKLWLQEHPEFNFSAFTRGKLDEYIKQHGGNKK